MSDIAIQTVRVVDARAISPVFRPLTAGRPPEQDSAEVTVPAAQDVFAPATDFYALGLDDGQKLAGTAFEIERTHLRNLLASASALQPEPSEELAVLISETVERLVTEIVGTAPIDPEWLEVHARRAAALVAQCDGARTLWLNPEDIAIVESCETGLTLMADPDAPRGSIRIDCSASWIEHGTALYLDELRAELGLKGGPA